MKAVKMKSEGEKDFKGIIIVGPGLRELKPVFRRMKLLVMLQPCSFEKHRRSSLRLSVALNGSHGWRIEWHPLPAL
jgi:hypothetical protein